MSERGDHCEADRSEGGRLIAYRTSLLRWNEAKRSVAADVARLREDVVQAYPEFAEPARRLDDLLEPFSAGLADTLDAALNATVEDERARLHAKAAGIVERYRRFVADNAVMKLVDENPYRPLAIQRTLADALDDLAEQLAR